MNIWIINHHACGPGRHSNMANQLASRGYEITLFASSFEHNSYRELVTYEKGGHHKVEWESGFKRIWINTPSYLGNGIKRIVNQLVFTLRVLLVARLFNRPDLIIGSSVHLFAAWAGYRLSRRYGVPFIFEVRDLWPQTLVDIGALKPKSPVTIVLRRLEIFLYRKADKIISVLPNGVDYISGLGIPGSKVVYIPNGIDVGWFDSCRQKDRTITELDAFFNFNQDKYIFTYTGAHGIANGLETVVEAADILQRQGEQNIKILLVGDGPLKQSLIRKSKNLRLNNIYFHPAVPKGHVPVILSKSYANLVVGKKSQVHKYGVSMNKIFDYMASAKPLIFAVSTSFDFAREADCGMSIEADNPALLAEAMFYLTQLQPEKIERMGFNGRQYVERHHEYSVLADALERCFKEIAGVRGCPAGGF